MEAYLSPRIKPARNWLDPETYAETPLGLVLLRSAEDDVEGAEQSGEVGMADPSAVAEVHKEAVLRCARRRWYSSLRGAEGL